MAAGRHNITAEQGATFKLNFTIMVDATSTPWDLTGYTARMQVRATPEASVKLLDLTSPTEIVLGGTAGTISIEVLDLDIVQGKYVYDFEVVSAGGEIWRVLEGKFTVKVNVTR